MVLVSFYGPMQRFRTAAAETQQETEAATDVESERYLTIPDTRGGMLLQPGAGCGVPNTPWLFRVGKKDSALSRNALFPS